MHIIFTVTIFLPGTLVLYCWWCAYPPVPAEGLSSLNIFHSVYPCNEPSLFCGGIATTAPVTKIAIPERNSEPSRVTFPDNLVVASTSCNKNIPAPENASKLPDAIKPAVEKRTLPTPGTATVEKASLLEADTSRLSKTLWSR